MDSGNSASMQSSSGGGDEVDFDSRGGGGGGGESSFSSFLNINNFTSSINNPQLNILTHQNPSTTFFDPQNNFSNNNNENNNMIWSTRGGLRSESIYPSFNTHHQSIATTTTRESVGPYPGPSSSVQLQPTHAGSDLHRNNNSSSLSNVIKNPKKRTRASRRAPTTVLTTDTTNFRQMVQEFTGIPAAPFTGNNTSSYSRRLDLYSAASALRSGAYLDSLGPLYPLRPAKGIMDSSTTTRMNVFGGAAATSSSSNNYNNQGQLPLMNLQQQQQGQEESGNPIPMNFGNLMSGGGTSFHHHGQEVNNGGGVDQENFDDGNIISNNRSSEQHLVVRNLNISDKNNEGNVASWNYPSTS